MMRRAYNKSISFNIDILKEATYVLLLITFFVGVILGSISLKNVSDSVFDEYRQGLEEMLIDSKKTGIDSEDLLDGFKVILFFWLAGLSMVGMPVLIGYIGYKGFSLGYTISTISRLLETSEAKDYIFKCLFVENSVMIFIMISMAVFSIKIFKNFLENKENIKVDFFRYTIFTMLLVGLLVGIYVIF